jgi:DNA-binding IclR family transcriptional regulator
VTYLVKIPANAARGAASFTQESGQLEAYCSGIGKVLLAHLPPGERRLYLAGSPFVALTPRTITDPRALEDALQTVRDEGFARDDGEIAEDLYCLAVPVRNRQGQVFAAISLSFPRDAHSPDRDAEYLAGLRACAADISTRLGWRPKAPNTG